MIEITQEFLEGRPLSYSSLKAFRKSPRHYIQYITQPRKPSAGMALGLLVHVLTLEPTEFEKRYLLYVKPTGTGSVKVMNNLKDIANEARKILITQDELDEANRIKQALMDHEMSRILIESRRKSEITLRWRHKTTNLPLTGKVDFESKAWDTDFILDLKTGNSADPDEFVRQSINLDYHIQVGAYTDGYPRQFYKFPDFMFIVVETAEPYNVSCIYCDNKYVEQAKDEFYGTLMAFRRCMDRKQFNMGYEFRHMETMDYFSMELPKWYRSKFVGIEND